MAALGNLQHTHSTSHRPQQHAPTPPARSLPKRWCRHSWQCVRTDSSAMVGNKIWLIATRAPPYSAPSMAKVPGCASSSSASIRAERFPCRCKWLVKPGHGGRMGLH